MSDEERNPGGYIAGADIERDDFVHLGPDGRLYPIDRFTRNAGTESIYRAMIDGSYPCSCPPDSRIRDGRRCGRCFGTIDETDDDAGTGIVV